MATGQPGCKHAGGILNVDSVCELIGSALWRARKHIYNQPAVTPVVSTVEV